MPLTELSISKRRHILTVLRELVLRELGERAAASYDAVMPDPSDAAISKREWEFHAQLWRQLCAHPREVCYIEGSGFRFV